ncbi:hypothetical protein PU560_04755, partial [Georgenia sp. 10Sc9-8]|nr:hypothetical protein [Georgenia halotolerans]
MSRVESRRQRWSPHVASSSLALALRAEVEANSRDRLLVAITGPRGSGKSLLLADLAAVYRAAGVDTRRGDREIDLIDLPDRCAILVDDAHVLAEDALNRLHGFIDNPETHLAVAYRPWPQPPALRLLVEALEQQRPPVVLGALTPEEVAAYFSTALGRTVPASTVEAVTELTGGMPWLLQRTLGSVHEGAIRSSAVAPPAVVEELRHDLDRLEDDLRDFLLALAVGFDLADPSLPSALTRAPAEDLLAEARAGGLILPGDVVIPLIAQALLATAPSHKVRALQRDLVEARTAEGRSLDDVARSLARSGMRHPGVARSLETMGEAALPTRPELAGQLFDEAVAAGGDSLAMSARRAQAAVLTGHLERSGQLLEKLLEAEDPPDLARAVDVSAAVWAQRGMLARSADAYRWLGADRVGPSAPSAAVTMLATGDVPGARAMLAAAEPPSPTLHAAAMAALADGVRESVEGNPARALAALVRASDMKTS